MKKLVVIIIALVVNVFGADPLNKIYDRYKMSETIENYKKADTSMVILTSQEWNNLPEDIKNQWANYGAYTSWARTQINSQKQAVRDQLATDKTRLGNSDKYTTEEKTQYSAEIDSAINTIIDIAGAK